MQRIIIKYQISKIFLKMLKNNREMRKNKKSGQT